MTNDSKENDEYIDKNGVINFDRFIFSEENIKEEKIFDKELFDKESLDDDLKDLSIDEILFNDFNDKLEEDLESEEYTLELDNVDTRVSLEEAVSDFKQGIQEGFEYIYIYYKPILLRWGKRNNNEELGIELLDVVLLNAVNAFNENAGAKFNTYFWTCAQHYITVYYSKLNAQKRHHDKCILSLNQQLSYKDEDGSELEKLIKNEAEEDDMKNYELKMAIESLDELKPNEKEILLQIIDKYTLDEIGNSFDISAAAICMALKRLGKRKNVKNKLRDILTNY